MKTTKNLFTKKERSTFPYWFAHWCAFQMTALNLKCWKPKYLLHDIEKPFLKLFWDYKKVQKWHRIHNAHHTEYEGKWDTYAMVIDWECSRFTKAEAQLNAYNTLKKLMIKSNSKEYKQKLCDNISPVLYDLNLISYLILLASNILVMFDVLIAPIIYSSILLIFN